MIERETEILIIGGGAAGLAAAASAPQKRITIIDDNPELGGQIWRSEMGRIKSPEARLLIEKIGDMKVSILNSTQVFASGEGSSLRAEGPGGAIKVSFDKLILATGARERFLPFPNWTLPNIFGAGGLQALVKGGFSVENKRIVVAGSGPLLLAVAEYLKSKGANVLLIAEQASSADLLKFGFTLWREAKKIRQAVILRSKLRGVAYRPNSFVLNAEGRTALEAVTIMQNGAPRRVECDMLACGFHLVPNTELASLLGCDLENGFVKVNDLQETTAKNVLCAGEPTGIGGVELALVEGKIAGLAAGGRNEEARRFFDEREKCRRFAAALNRCFCLRDELKQLPDAKTIVCRCEDVRFEDLKRFESWREAKIQTRCGMGSCQGRICGAATEILFDWKNESVRPPIFPVKLENLGS